MTKKEGCTALIFPNNFSCFQEALSTLLEAIEEHYLGS